MKHDERQNIMELLANSATECRVDLGVSNEKVQPKFFEETQKAIETSGASSERGYMFPLQMKQTQLSQKGKVSLAGDNS